MEFLNLASCLVCCLWNSSKMRVAYIRALEDNLTSLRSAMDTLKNLSQDVRNRVTEAEQQLMERTVQVNGWLEKVEEMERKVENIVQKGEEELKSRCLGCCNKNCRPACKIAKTVMNMIPLVTALRDEGTSFDVIASQLPPPAVDELPVGNVVRFESKFKEVWEPVHNRSYPVIGLYGIGGAGKTTLLKQLNNEFLKVTHGYGSVIWIEVSKPANVGTIQEIIRNKINILDPFWDTYSESKKVIRICNKLKAMKFVLLLDNIWERLDLSKVGVPQPDVDNMSKVVFTTRSLDVCGSMDAYKSIEVGCLPPDQAFSLFRSKVGEDMLQSHPELHALVDDVARKCQGLPLALVTIGRAMKDKTRAQQWEDAKATLERYPSTFQGMEGDVFGSLLLSYDYLPTQTHKKCFEYCALYPKNHTLAEEEIIQLWLAERLIDEYDSMSDAFVQGRRVIDFLMQACLLEKGEREGDIRMHDVIREMALWIACDKGEKKNKYWVVASGDLDGISDAPAEWMTTAEKVSLWGSGTTLKSSTLLPSCSTLIVRDTRMKEVPVEVIRSMHALEVLDLSGNFKLEMLPPEIGLLTNMEYLNVARTRMSILPEEVAQLVKLRSLIVDCCTIVSGSIISSLILLKRFEQIPKLYYNETGPNPMETQMLIALAMLTHIMDLRLVLTSSEGINALLGSMKLQSCTSQLSLQVGGSFPKMLDLCEGTLTSHLERLQVCIYELPGINLGNPSLRNNNLREVSLMKCAVIRNLSSLAYASNLCILFVGDCDSMDELIGEDVKNVGISLFDSLTTLTLCKLVSLKSICPQEGLQFPSLKLMKVDSCYSLAKLPLDSNTANTAHLELKIQGQREWWDGLQWDNPATKNAFTPKFVRIDDYGIPVEP